MSKIRLEKVKYRYTDDKREKHYNLFVEINCAMSLREKIAKKAKIEVWKVIRRKSNYVIIFLLLMGSFFILLPFFTMASMVSMVIGALFTGVAIGLGMLTDIVNTEMEV